jgi:hypothetical protein
MPVPLFSGAAQPVLANYVPVLNHPVFLAGLSLFVLGVALCGVLMFGGMLRHVLAGKQPAWRIGVLLSIVAAAMALAGLFWSLGSTGMPAMPETFEILAWGPGHLLQFVHVLLLMSVWIVLSEQAIGAPVAQRRWLIGLLLLGAAPLLAAPFIYFAYPVGSTDFRRAFTLLMAWGSWPAAALLGVQVLLRLRHAGRSTWAAPHGLALLASVLLFFLGCLLGAMIRGDSTMVPAHYHGTVGAITLAYMALGYRMLPSFGLVSPDAKWISRQVVLYGAGLATLALALAWSGWFDVPRKTAHVDILGQYPTYIAAMGLTGLGGMLAIIGAVLFVVNIVGCLRIGRQEGVKPARRDVRMMALALTMALTAVAGTFFAYLPSDPGLPVNASSDAAATHVAQKRKDEITRRFTEAVARLKAREYEEAASALHRVLQLAPQMPEAHVNMGFALIGLGKYAMARDFFESAIALRTTQMNA